MPCTRAKRCTLLGGAALSRRGGAGAGSPAARCAGVHAPPGRGSPGHQAGQHLHHGGRQPDPARFRRRRAAPLIRMGCSARLPSNAGWAARATPRPSSPSPRAKQVRGRTSTGWRDALPPRQRPHPGRGQPAPGCRNEREADRWNHSAGWCRARSTRGSFRPSSRAWPLTSRRARRASARGGPRLRGTPSRGPGKNASGCRGSCSGCSWSCWAPPSPTSWWTRAWTPALARPRTQRSPRARRRRPPGETSDPRRRRRAGRRH
jgi:hypothetical protein